ncbi:UNVERIFIED_CONTAM: hypothetical protein RMT77_009674 [Armadillidium vulgare]
MVLRVAVEEWIPHVKLNVTPDGKVQIFGPLANLLEALATSLQFQYKLSRPPDGGWGIPNNDGSWSGMIGMVQRNEADFALGPFGLTDSRSKIVEFSTPILIDYYRILVKRPNLQRDPWVFLNPFSFDAWIGLIINMVFTIISLTVIFITFENKILVKKSKNLQNTSRLSSYSKNIFSRQIWSVFGTLIGQPYPLTLNSYSGRITIIIWLMCFVVLSKTYSSTLTSLLAVRSLDPKYNSLNDLVKDKEMHLVFEKATAWVEYLSKVQEGIYKGVADTTAEGRTHFLSSTELFDAAYNEVKRAKYALLVEETTCKKIFSDDFSNYGKCNFYLGKKKFWPLIYALIGRKGDVFMKKINSRLERIISHDLYSKWLSKEYPNASVCLNSPTTFTVKESYAINGLWGVFVVLIGGSLLSTVCFILEYTCFRYKCCKFQVK